MNQIQEWDPSIIVRTGEIYFQDYAKLLEEAKLVAQGVQQMEVTEDNVKEVKKILAKVNKSVKTLNDRRIEIKKQINAPYEVFAEQIKEIEKIVKDADEIVRNEVRMMEEQEREDKKQKLKSIWDARIELYEYSKIMNFEDWLEPSHLNKTESLKKSEQAMTDWLEFTERNIETLSTMQHSQKLIHEYKLCKDVAQAIQNVNDEIEAMQEEQTILKNEDVNIQKYYLEIYSEADLELVEMLLEKHGINYKLR